MQLRTTPAKRECKEKVNRKSSRGKEIRNRDCIEVPLAAWLNIIFSIILRGQNYRSATKTAGKP
jgi:hypothetical protein